MSELTIWTLDWVPEGPRGFVRHDPDRLAEALWELLEKKKNAKGR